jgi:hypothetical protein
LINYPVLPNATNMEGRTESTSISFLPIATWICSSRAILSVQPPAKAHDVSDTVFLICKSPNVAPQLDSHYFGPEQRGRRDRLKEAPLWISMDLQFMFSDWSKVWNLTREDLSTCHSQIHGDVDAPPLLDLTRKLHKDTARIIALREQLRVHAGALVRLLRLVNTKTTSPEISALVERISECQEDITYQEETSQVILRQLENLLSLVSYLCE